MSPPPCPPSNNQQLIILFIFILPIGLFLNFFSLSVIGFAKYEILSVLICYVYELVNSSIIFLSSQQWKKERQSLKLNC